MTPLSTQPRQRRTFQLSTIDASPGEKELEEAEDILDDPANTKGSLATTEPMSSFQFPKKLPSATADEKSPPPPYDQQLKDDCPPPPQDSAEPCRQASSDGSQDPETVDLRARQRRASAAAQSLGLDLGIEDGSGSELSEGMSEAELRRRIKVMKRQIRLRNQGMSTTFRHGWARR